MGGGSTGGGKGGPSELTSGTCLLAFLALAASGLALITLSAVSTSPRGSGTVGGGREGYRTGKTKDVGSRRAAPIQKRPARCRVACGGRLATPARLLRKWGSGGGVPGEEEERQPEEEYLRESCAPGNWSSPWMACRSRPWWEIALQSTTRLTPHASVSLPRRHGWLGGRPGGTSVRRG